VSEHAVLEPVLGDRLEHEPVGEVLELLLLVDRHAGHLPRLGELGLQVDGVPKPECPLSVDSMLGLPEHHSQRVRTHDPDRRDRRRDRIDPSCLLAT
jgi:hypothetical protein